MLPLQLLLSKSLLHFITLQLSFLAHIPRICISLIFWKFCRSNFSVLQGEPRQFVSFKLQLFSNTCQNIFFVYLTDHRSFCFHLGSHYIYLTWIKDIVQVQYYFKCNLSKTFLSNLRSQIDFCLMENDFRISKLTWLHFMCL